MGTRRGGPLAPPGVRPSFRPSSLQPPPTRRTISNRESFLLEINATQTKQTPAIDSNRENNTLLRRGGPFLSASIMEEAPPALRPSVRASSLGPPPTRDRSQKNCNRESFLLEIDVTQTRQSPAVHSNREKDAHFSTAKRAEIRAGLKARPYDGFGELNSNRESFLLETYATRTKQTVAPDSNREKDALFITAGWAEKRAGRNITARPYNDNDTGNGERNPRKTNKKPAPFLFRLKPTPLLYFHRLTAIFNRTTFRLRRISSEIKTHIINRFQIQHLSFSRPWRKTACRSICRLARSRWFARCAGLRLMWLARHRRAETWKLCTWRESKPPRRWIWRRTRKKPGVNALLRARIGEVQLAAQDG
jgi:hypothetical protein